jgi:hypothetical protein
MKIFRGNILTNQMELVVEPDVYSPSVDEHGNYVDNVLCKKGLICPCGSRKDKVYETQSVFSAHTKTKTHQRWLADLNANRANFYVENEKLKELIQNQRLIIARLEKDINNKNATIDYLTQQVVRGGCPTVNNLLEFD